MSERTIARLIYPAGFYRTKARHLRQAGRLLDERHAGRVPEAMEDLLALPGVGRKTANLVRTCTPLSPKCSACPIRRHCARAGVTHSR